MANVTITTAALDIDQVWSPELNRAIQLDIVIAALFDDKSALVDQNSEAIPLVDSWTAGQQCVGKGRTAVVSPRRSSNSFCQ